MGSEFQIHRAAVDLAKGYSQAQKAVTAFVKEKDDRASQHIDRALKDFSAAGDHLALAVDDTYAEAGKEIDHGNSELKKSLHLYADGKDDKADDHFDRAMKHYDKALDLIH